ncbi:MAG TPA: DnaB-like helicase C-terminal domain-containing protein [Kiritimatiellia bacterium]|nr:DnaB-like helicase C-terminal domain-containing protein [Kiritimatiellia bacterium]HPS09584.1 DnaB-like helicase C-terminal domain-containing protein [Kiritimatiellia bacterium]
MQTDIETDIEAALIGCFMLDYPGTVSETADFSITPEMFVSGLARQTFEAIQSLAADKSPIDPLTVRQKLGRYGEGGEAISAFLCGAIDITPTAAHAGYYGQLLRQRHETRRLRQILHASARRLDDEPADMVQADLMRQLERNDPDPAQDGITFAQATDQAVETFRQIAAGTGGIKTGLAFLDSAGGIQEGELIIISGKAGSCKTTLARQILGHVCGNEGIPSALVTLEMTESQIAAQTLTDRSQTSYRKFMAGVADEQDWARLFAAKAKAEKWPLAITSRTRTPTRLAAYVRKVVRRGAKLIVLDYLQAMQADPAMARSNIEQQVTFASNTVRDLAVNLGVRFIVVSTESREGELRYSDALRYDAWKWFRMIQPEENNEDNPVYHLEVKKNRFGVVPKTVRPLYRVGDRLLTDTEWLEHSNRRQLYGR